MTLRSIAEASKRVQSREISPVELTRECLEVIERLGPALNAFITITAASATTEAEQAEREILAGSWRGPLHGIPLGLKDLIDTAGVRTTAGSAIFKDRVPTEDAAVVTKLRTAGAIFLGKQNLHEFAYGGSSLISHFGPVRNPVNPEFVAGGSSGGSAAAVASGMCFGAIGTDTAGSIREPAALCGVVGFKPTYALVSTAGIIPLSVSLDHAGPIARTVEDTAILLDALTGNAGELSYRATIKKDLKRFVAGVPREFFFAGLDAEVELALDQAINQLVRLGAEIREIELPEIPDRTLQSVEAYQYHREMVARSPELYDPETLRRIRTGENVSPAAHETALQEQRKSRSGIVDVIKEIAVDFIITPTVPIPAPRIAPLLEDRSRLRPVELLLLRNTRPMNVWGLPAISVPCGLTSAGLPIGLQISGAPGRDAEVLQIAYAFEQLRTS